MSKETFYVAMALNLWENVSFESPEGEPPAPPIKVHKKGDYVGFLPVFKTEEAAREAHPNRAIQKVVIDAERTKEWRYE